MLSLLRPCWSEGLVVLTNESCCQLFCGRPADGHVYAPIRTGVPSSILGADPSGPVPVSAASRKQSGCRSAIPRSYAVPSSSTAINPLTTANLPEINTEITHLREVLGDQAYESLARKGEAMTASAMATYAYDQIDQARTELNAVSK